MNKTVKCVFFPEIKGVYSEELEGLQRIILHNDIVDVSTIAAKMMSLQRRIENVRRYGNCLFEAVADQIANHPTKPVPIDHKMLRRMTVNFMKNHKDLLQVNEWAVTYQEYGKE